MNAAQVAHGKLSPTCLREMVWGTKATSPQVPWERVPRVSSCEADLGNHAHGQLSGPCCDWLPCISGALSLFSLLSVRVLLHRPQPRQPPGLSAGFLQLHSWGRDLYLSSAQSGRTRGLQQEAERLLDAGLKLKEQAGAEPGRMSART